MTTEYSSPYKVGLIDVGTEFAQSRPLWSEIAYGKLNFHRYSSTKVRSKCKPCSTSISPSNNSVWHKVCGFLFFVRRLDFRFRPFGFFGFRFDIRSDSGFGEKKM